MSYYEIEIDGIECLARIDSYHPSRPMAITGWGFGDAEPPEPAEVEWTVCNVNGDPSNELAALLGEKEWEDLDVEITEWLETLPRGWDEY